MLNLSRRVGQKIVIGSGPDRIELIVVDIRKNGVKLGITAPREVPIIRQELLDGPTKREKGE